MFNEATLAQGVLSPNVDWSTMMLQDHIIWNWWECLVFKYLLVAFLFSGTAMYTIAAIEIWRSRKKSK